MKLVTFKVSIPKDLLGIALGLNEQKVQKEFKEWLIISLFQEGRISSGKATDLLKLKKREFLNLLDKKGIAHFNYSSQEWEEELEAAKKLIPKK